MPSMAATTSRMAPLYDLIPIYIFEASTHASLPLCTQKAQELQYISASFHRNPRAKTLLPFLAARERRRRGVYLVWLRKRSSSRLRSPGLCVHSVVRSDLVTAYAAADLWVSCTLKPALSRPVLKTSQPIASRGWGTVINKIHRPRHSL